MNFSCDCGYTFEASGPYGKIPCPFCRSAWIVSKRGIRPVQTIRIKLDRHGVSDVDRLFRVMRATDGTILCSGCATRTDLLTGRQGTLAGKHGVYCVLCLATRPVKIQNDTERTVKGFLRVQPVTWNNPVQRLESETGILQIARAIQENADPMGYGVLLTGANWQGLRVREIPRKLVGLPSDTPQITRTVAEHNANRANILRTPERIEVQGIGAYLVGSPDPWFAVATIHPDHCTCQTCKRHGSDRRVALRPVQTEQVTVYNGVTLASVRPVASGIGQASINVVTGILARPERQPIRVTRCEHYERTLPRATRPQPDPPMPQPLDNAVTRAFRRAMGKACSSIA